MKKERISKFLYVISLVLLVGFCIRVGADYVQYRTTLNSAPFSVFVLVRAVEFVFPAIVLFAVAKILDRKRK